MQKHLDRLRQNGKTIGFAPTMGALHEGHLSLIRQATGETDCTVCSIFVNPAQFNDPDDLKKYPRTPGKDIGLLNNAACDLLFMPPVEEVYPPGLELPPPLDFGFLDQPMEGAHRPGHFAGMAKVVRRLLDIVQPDRLYLGQKDFQQYAIVQDMLRQLQSSIRLVRCPIVREADGLAMSSRNVRLTGEGRALAPSIFKALRQAKEKTGKLPPRQIEQEALEQLTLQPGMVPEYFEIVEGDSLQPVESWEGVSYAVACVAVKVGEIRLIDNHILIER